MKTVKNTFSDVNWFTKPSEFQSASVLKISLFTKWEMIHKQTNKQTNKYIIVVLIQREIHIDER